MRTFAGVVGLGFLAAGFSLAQEGVRREMARLEGTWQLVSAVKDGKKTPEDVIAKIRVVIKGGKHSVFFGKEAAVKEIPFVIDPTKNPKTTVDTLPDGRKIHGIYKLEGDVLTSCVAEPNQAAPKRFAAEPGSGHTLRVFRRVQGDKKAEDAP